MIKITNLDKYFNKRKQNEVHVINDISADFPSVGMVAIFGKSGCGKTTLLNVIGGLDSKDGGNVEIDGENIGKNTDYIRNRKIGYIFQNYNLCKDRTVFENVADVLRLCGEKDADLISERVNASLKSVGMENYAKRLPDTLSGGQQQRIAIARAVVKSPAIILADEPTGNLDEQNTFKIMDMLKKISETCLVILVTHEEKLVYEYCDRIISLSDGKIVGINDNEGASGSVRGNTHDIFLGDYERKTFNENGASIDFYGERPETPIRVTFINRDGRIYLSVDGDDVSILDDRSEIRIRQGKSEEIHRAVEAEEFTRLPELSQKSKSRYGKLFSVKDGIKTGLSNVFGVKSKSIKLFRRSMMFFGAVIVLLGAFFGKNVQKKSEIKKGVGDSFFYVSASEKTNNFFRNMLSDPATGIDWYSHKGSVYSILENPSFSINANYFSSFSGNIAIKAEANALPFTLSSGKIICGSADRDKGGIWLSKDLADKLIETSDVGYIKTYTDLLNTVSSTGRTVTAVTDDRGMYYYDSGLFLAEIENSSLNLSYSPSLNDGEAVYYSVDGYYKVGDKIKLNGLDVTLTKTVNVYGSYLRWLAAERPDIYENASGSINSEYVGPSSENDLFFERVKEDEAFRNKWFPDYAEGVSGSTECQYALLRYIYSVFDEWVGFCRENNLKVNNDGYYFGNYYNSDLFYWVYLNGLDENAKYVAYETYSEMSYQYFYLRTYYEKNGSLPEDVYSYWESSEYNFDNYKDTLVSRYGDVFLNSGVKYDFFSSGMLYVSENDYIEISKCFGESTEPFGYNYERYINDFMILHSTDAAKTEKYLTAQFGEQPDDVFIGDLDFISPEMLLEYNLSSQDENIASSAVIFVVVLAALFACVFFIIRSSFLGRIKEIGTYRAIGVTKGNLIREFFLETLTLCMTTFFIGWAFMSAVLFFLLDKSRVLPSFIFYNPWFALLIFAGTVLICLISGLIPICTLLRKTPAQIISKYDI